MSKSLTTQNNAATLGQKPVENTAETYVVGKIAGVQGDVVIQLPNGRTINAKKGSEIPLDASVITFGSSSVVLTLDDYSSISLGHDETLLIDAALLALLEKKEESALDGVIDFERIQQALEDGEKLDELLPATAAGGETSASSSAGLTPRVSLNDERVTPESGFETQETETLTIDSYIDNTEYYNSPPTALGLFDLAINQDVAVNLNIASAFTDVDQGQTLSFNVSELPEGLSFDPQTGSIVGAATNNAAFTQSGLYHITVQAQDDSGLLNDATSTTFTLRVNNVNDAPTLGGERHIGNINEDESISFDSDWLLQEANDIDPIDTLIVSDIHIAHGNGELHNNGDGTYTFIPNENWFGDVSVSYTITDGNGGYASSVGTIDVAAVNDLPNIHSDDALQTTAGQTVSSNVLANDTDADGDTLSVVDATASHGSVNVNSDGELEYTPNVGFHGSDTIEYQVSDGQGGVVDASVAVNVNYTPGVITINPIEPGTNATPIISGTATGDIVGDITLELNGETHTVVVEDESWTFTLPDNESLDDGEYTVVVTGEDAIGESIQQSETFVVDVHQPEVSIENIDQAPSQASFQGSASHTDGNVQLNVNGQSYELTVNDDGSWSFTLPAEDALADGEYEVTVSAHDNQGNAASANDHFIVDDLLPSIDINDVTDPSEHSPVITGTSAHVEGAITITVNGEETTVLPSGDGSWQLSLQELEDGNYSVVASAQDAQGNRVSDSMQFTIDAVDLIPDITGDFSASLLEDADDVLEATGDLDALNGDPGESEFIAENISGQYGVFTINSDGEWRYSADNSQSAIQNLTPSDSLTEIFTVTNSDGVTQADVEITIHGSDDVPVISGTVDASVTEDAADLLVVNGALEIEGGDQGENSFIASEQQGQLGRFVINENGDWQYQADNAQIAIQSMGEGSSQQEIFIVSSADGVTTQTITITLNGENDAPIVEQALLVSGEENEGFSLNLLAGASDIDIGDNISVENLTLVSGDASGVSLLENTLSVSSSAYDGLTENESETIIYNYTLVDGNGGSVAQTATITIEGANDVPVITGDVAASLVEDAADSLVAMGTLSATGGDAGEDQFTAESLQGNYGELTIQANGEWTYTADNAQAAIQGLDENSDALNDQFTVTNADGVTEQTITISITGADDVPSISGATEASVTEDDAATLIASGTLNISGGDNGENSFVESTQQGVLGSFRINENGEWQYEADNAQLAIQSMGANASQQEVFTVSSVDGSATETITIVVNGNNDAPEVTQSINKEISENDGLSLDLLAGASDIDIGDSINIENITLVNGDDSGVTISGNILHVSTTAYDGLAPGESEVIEYRYTIADENGGAISQTATITVVGADDVPIISGTTEASLTEDSADTLVASGSLTIEGGDDGDDVFIPSVQQGDFGRLTIDENGEWQYEADNNQLVIQSIGVNASQVESFTVASADGATTQDISITINGVNDAPTLEQFRLYFLIDEDEGFTFDLLQGANDVDEGDTLSIENFGYVRGDDSGISISGTTLTVSDTTYNYVRDGEAEVVIYFYDVVDSNGESIPQRAILVIKGNDDVPVIDGDIAAALVEDDAGTLIANGTLTASGGDTGEEFFVRETAYGDYGEFSVNENGEWQYSADNSQEAIQNLNGSDDVLTEQFIVTNADGVTLQTINIEIVGNDIPEVYVTDKNGADVNLSAILARGEAPVATDDSDIIVGSAGDDSLEGLLGEDILFGSTGSDTLSGGEDSDTFLWIAGDADGSVDTVLDFEQGNGGDVLNFADLLQGENADALTLDAYFDFSSDGQDTTIEIDVDGDGSGADLEVLVADVDLTLIGDDQAILQSLIDQNNLLVDA